MKSFWKGFEEKMAMDIPGFVKHVNHGIMARVGHLPEGAGDEIVRVATTYGKGKTHKAHKQLKETIRRFNLEKKK